MYVAFRACVQHMIFVCRSGDQVIVYVTVHNCVMPQLEIYMARIRVSAFWTLQMFGLA